MQMENFLLKNKNNYDVKLENYDASYGKNAYVVAISIDDDGNIVGWPTWASSGSATDN